MMRFIQHFVMLVALTQKVGGSYKNTTAKITAGTHAKKDVEQ